MHLSIRSPLSRAGVALVSAIGISYAGAESGADNAAIEVNETGQIAAVDPALEKTPGGGGSVVTGRHGLPFGATPSWQNALRRQVGGLAVGDLNGDGRNDVVVGCFQSQSFPPYPEWKNYIYFNTGSGLENAPSWTSTDQVHTGDVRIADFNDDGFPDIFSANGGTGFSACVIYFGSAAGPSTAPGWSSTIPRRAWTTSALPFDFDHDGDIDVLTTNQGLTPDPYRPMYLFRNTGSGLETTPSWQSSEASIQNFLAVADYDGDGWEDAAVSKWVNFESGIYRNVAGTLTTTPVWTTGLTGADRGVLWNDFDGDRWPDLLIGEGPTQLYRNVAATLTPDWTLTPPFNGVQDMLLADLDRDGDQDVVEVHFSDGRTHVYLTEDGRPGPAPSWTYDSTAVGNAVAVGDINGDRWPDLVIGYSGDVSVVVFYNTLRWPTGDMNCDRLVNFDDIDGFVVAVIGRVSYAAAYPNCDWENGDIDGSAAVDFDDIDGFVACLVGGACP